MAQGVGHDGRLFAQLCEPAFLIGCARVAARGKRKRSDVARYLLDLEPNCFDLARKIADGSWRPQPCRTFWIRDPKPRLISAATFRDRVVHHGLVALLEPLFERRFVAHSYACRREKGTHRALRRALCLARRRRFCLKGDVVKFFPSLDHAVVKDLVRRVVGNERLLQVLDHVIDDGPPQERVVQWFPGDALFTPMERCRGLPIGSLTSQFLANVVLDRLDHFVMDHERCGEYVRYGDDFLVFGDDRAALWRLRERVVALLSTLRLKLHDRKGGVLGTKNPIPFLGFVIRDGGLRLARSGIVRATRRFRMLRDELARGEVDPPAVTRSVQSWIAHASFGRTLAVRARVLSEFSAA